MKAGAEGPFNMHYHRSAIRSRIAPRSASCSTRSRRAPKHVITTILSPNQDDPRHFRRLRQRILRTDAYFEMKNPPHLVGFMPHMHNRGKRQCLERLSTAGRALKLRQHDFNWQNV